MLETNRPLDAMSLDHPHAIVKHQTATRDAFLGGRLVMEQPSHGFRAGLDSVLLGAAVKAEAGELLDLGAGAGTAGLVALAFRPGLVATLVENDAAVLPLLAGNIAANGLDGRASVLDLDVTASGAVRAAAGLRTDCYASVIANPPFFAAESGTLASTRGAAARHMAGSAIDRWVRTAAASAAPGGEVIFIHAAPALAPLLAAFDARFGAIAILPFAPRAGDAASRVLVRAIKGSRAPLTLHATRALHGEGGRAFVPEIEAVLRGVAPLVW